ncbi:unnamed protein product [Linum trigynum]|uniref:Uncharacterized protein n=1 Tax=Linum trigynum TaxID=586398 RepID=A0AAV2FTK8_9ROSI
MATGRRAACDGEMVDGSAGEGDDGDGTASCLRRRDGGRKRWRWWTEALARATGDDSDGTTSCLRRRAAGDGGRKRWRWWTAPLSLYCFLCSGRRMEKEKER